MDYKTLKMINTGTCAYFLIPYSCLTFLLDLWYTEKGYGLFLSLIFFLLMLLKGVSLLKKFRKILTNDPDNGSSAAVASSAVKLIGGSLMLIIILQLLIRMLIMSAVQFSPQAVRGILFFSLPCFPFLIFAVTNIRKGFVIKAGKAASGSIDFLCYRVILLYLFFTGIYQLAVWLQSIREIPDFSIMPVDSINLVPLGSAALAIILYFAPLRIKSIVKNTDDSNYRYLSSQSCVTSGYILLLTVIFGIASLLIPVLARLVSGIGRYDGGSFLLSTELTVGLLPYLIFLIISISVIIYGKKRSA